MPPLTEQNRRVRANRIGASDVGAIMGADPFRSGMAVWARIVLGEEPATTEPMRIGTALEGSILRLWAGRAGVKIRRNHRTRARGVLAATADAFVVWPASTPRPWLVEAKYSTWHSWPNDEPPPHIRFQAIAQAYVYRAARVTVVGLVAGRLLEWTTEPSRHERRHLYAECANWYERHVVTREYPIPIFSAEVDVVLRLIQGTADRRPATDAEEEHARVLATWRRVEGEARHYSDAARTELLRAIATDPAERVIGDAFTYERRNGSPLIRTGGPTE